MQLQYKTSNQSGETLISLIIGVFIFSIIVFAIMKILANNYAIEEDFIRNNRIHLMELNATNILRRIPTNQVNEKEVFYLYKDVENKEFIVFTGSTNSQYQNVNFFGEPIVNPESFTGTLYMRTFIVDQYDSGMSVGNQIIKGTIRELIKRDNL